MLGKQKEPKPTLMFRRDTLENWMEHNVVLSVNEPGFVFGPDRFVIGDGKTPFNELKWPDCCEFLAAIGKYGLSWPMNRRHGPIIVNKE